MAIVINRGRAIERMFDAMHGYLKSKGRLSCVGMLAIVVLTGCVNHYAAVDAALAEGLLRKALHTGNGFEHSVFFNHAAMQLQAKAKYQAGGEGGPSNRRRLHVYIGGDGTPWVEGRYIARDPTPLNPIALKMFMQDAAPAVFLGRPCYFDAAPNKHCKAEFWTSHRYSERVVSSMAAALAHILAQYNTGEVVLFGYSGGGAIASLLAPRLPGLFALVTIAGNLDTDVWVAHHQYLPLSGSLNPAQQLPSAHSYLSIHLAGEQDQVVPPAIPRAYIAHQGGYLKMYPAYGHVCCWVDDWAGILQELPQLYKSASVQIAK